MKIESTFFFAGIYLIGTLYGGADRSAEVDSNGVMRWCDDGSEVAVFGVNYYAPFALDYRLVAELGFDHKKVIRDDVAQFRRLGLTAIRLHCFDREFSNREGGFVDNHHVELLDYLIAECASNGIYTILTPIAAWGGGKWTSSTNGFAYPVGIKQLTSNRELWKAEARFEREFAEHVNRYTGRRYADDPCILAFELINEPGYPDGTTGEQIAVFANTLLDGIRASGTRKPVFYSATWNGRNDSIPFLRTDGVSGVYYVTGLDIGHALDGYQLCRVQGSSLKPEPRLERTAKIIYEFDAADTPGAYMYPALARLFRSEGVQSATQFQYDTTVLGNRNSSYRTHYLNLIYTPEKAISMAIAAEVFRRTPRYAVFKADSREMIFPPFRVNAAHNLSEMVTETDLLYTATPMTVIHAPEKLRRVWGVGASAVAASSGNGCYFLDRVRNGVWRLQLYPSVKQCADPYTGIDEIKVAVLADMLKLKLSIPDLGSGFTAWHSTDGKRCAVARGGEMPLAPGDYILTVSATLEAETLSAARSADIPHYAAPPPHANIPDSGWPMPLVERAERKKKTCPTATEWNFFDVDDALACHSEAITKRTRITDDAGRTALRLMVDGFSKVSAVTIRPRTDGAVYATAFPVAQGENELIFHGCGACGHSERIEFAVILDDGQAWGAEVILPAEWGNVHVPISSLRHFAHWENQFPLRSGDVPDMRRAVAMSFCIGRWLDEEHASSPHGFELSFIHLVNQFHRKGK